MKRAILTGASSGIGLALARELASRGWALTLLARRTELIEALAKELPNAEAITCDVSDREAVRNALAGKHFDLAIANAGIGHPTHAAKFPIEQAEQIIKTNVLGTMYLLDAVVPSMIERRSGHFAAVASLAGYRGLPGASVYSASKAAMHAFLEATRIELAPFGITVTTINPGFIATPMTEKNKVRMPFLMQPPQTARVIANGLEARKTVIEFPLPMSILMRFVRWLPNAVYDRVTAPYARRISRSKGSGW